MTRRRTREIHEWIAERIDAGENLDDLAHELNVTREWLRTLNAPNTRSRGGRPFNVKRYENVLELADGSLTRAEVAKRLNITWVDVNIARKSLLRQGFDPKFKRDALGPKSNCGDERNEDIRIRHLRGESFAAIGRAHGLSRQRVGQILAKQYGMRKRSS